MTELSCRAIERRLVGLRTGAPPDAEIVAHRAVCPRCDELAEAWERARSGLRRHHAGLQPDPGFSARVLARVEDRAVGETSLDALAWAARRVLPVALALAVGLVGWGAVVEPAPSVESLVWGGAGDDQLARFVLAGVETPDAGRGSAP